MKWTGLILSGIHIVFAQMLEVYSGVFGSPGEGSSAHDERVSSVADGLLKGYISTVQWGLAAHSMMHAAASSPLHLSVIDTLPEEQKLTVRGTTVPQGVFNGDFGAAELITAMKLLMECAAEQSEALQADSLPAQAAVVAVGAWR
jgi:hypothetical protein